MAFKDSRQSRLLIGATSFSGVTKTFEHTDTTEMLEVTTLSDSAKVFIPGQTTSNVRIGMLLDTITTSAGQWDKATAWKAAAATEITYAPSGLAALSEVVLYSALEAEFSTTSAVASAVEASLTAQPNSCDAGYSLEDLAAVTGDTTGTARDLTASSSNGGIGFLHVTAFASITSNAVTIQDSADGSSGWATILTFSTYTGVTSQSVAITGTVRRYLRVVDDITGSGSTTRQVSFARR